MIGFHRLLIGTAIIFSILLAGWFFVEYRANGSGGYAVLSASFLIAAGGMTYYLRHLKRFLKR